MSKNSPTQRSLAMLRGEGWTCQITEKWNAFARVRQDLFGFCDILAICPRRGILAVQTTTRKNMLARRKKIAAEPRALTWIEAGGLVVIHGWEKGGKRSESPGKWICKIMKYPSIET